MGSEVPLAPDGNIETETFRRAVEHAGHPMYWTDTTGTIEYVNPAFEAQTGFAAEEAIGSNASILQSGVHDDRFYEQLWDTLLAGEVWEGEVVNERKDGERYIVSQTISPITDGSGEIVRFVAVNEDVTELRAYQDRLEAERDRFETLLDAVPVPLVLTSFDDGTPIVARTNRMFDEQFGFTEEQLAGSSLDAYIVDDAESENATAINEKIIAGEPVSREVIRRTADGEDRTFLLHACPLNSADRRQALGAYIDITDRKRAEAERKRKNEQLSEFADVVSHDLRNPLSVAVGHLELAAAECDSPHLETVENAHDRMRELIEDILTLAKQGTAIDELEAVDLSECVSRSWATISSADTALQIESTRTIRADESRLRQLLDNLLRNAVEHGATTPHRSAGEDTADGEENAVVGEEAVVTITVGECDDGFYVEDDGRGIPPDRRELVFESGHTTSENGTGFGLPIVREIATAHGWQVELAGSDAGGARFEFTGVEFVD